jgi:hypothetical protein
MLVVDGRRIAYLIWRNTLNPHLDVCRAATRPTTAGVRSNVHHNPMPSPTLTPKPTSQSSPTPAVTARFQTDSESYPPLATMTSWPFSGSLEGVVLAVFVVMASLFAGLCVLRVNVR